MHPVYWEYDVWAKHPGQLLGAVQIFNWARIFRYFNIWKQLRDASDVSLHPREDFEEVAVQYKCIPAEEDHQRLMEHLRQVLQRYELSNIRKYRNKHRMGLAGAAQLWFPHHTEIEIFRRGAVAGEGGEGGPLVGDKRAISLIFLTAFSYPLIINAPRYRH